MIDILLAVLIGIWVIVGVRYLVKEWQHKIEMEAVKKYCWKCRRQYDNSCPNLDECYRTETKPFFIQKEDYDV